MANHDSNGSSNDDIPEYSDLFPELLSSSTRGAPQSITQSTMLKSSAVTEVFQIRLEEQRLTSRNALGTNTGGRMHKLVDEVMKESNVRIDLSFSRDDTLTVVVQGKERNVLAAKATLQKRLQKQAEFRMTIPAAHYRTIIGPKGEKLKEIQEQTATRIKIPHSEQENGEIVITGPGDGCCKARDLIQYISDVESTRDRVKLDVLKAYHPLILGYKGENIKRIKESTGAAVHMPPPRANVDEIVVSGEKDAVALAVAQITAVYQELQRTCGELTANVKKSQHKYVIGPKGANLDDIMHKFGVVLEMPPPGVDSDVIILRGPEGPNLVAALTVVYEKANSVVTDELPVAGWLHRHIIGKKGAGLSELTQNFDKLHVKFVQADNVVRMDGPPEEVRPFKQMLMMKVAEMQVTMVFVDLKITHDHHSRIIGKGGATVSKIKETTGAQINFPEKDATGKDKDMIRIEGTKEAVKQAQQMIMEVTAKLENFRKVEVKVDQKFHSLIIGPGGAQIKKLLAECGDVSIDVPSSKVKSDVITVEGDKNLVAKAQSAIHVLVEKLKVENHSITVPIFKPYHGSVIGKGGINVTKIKDSTKTRIDIPDPSELITVTGTKANCELAKEQLLKIQNDIANVITQDVSIPPAVQSVLKGSIADAISTSCGGVIMKFPDGGKKVSLRGPETEVTKAAEELEFFAKEIASGAVVVEVPVDVKFHRQIVGRQGSNVAKLQTDSGARVMVPPAGQGSAKANAHVMLFGGKTECETAKAAILAQVATIENTGKDKTTVAKKHHRLLLANRAKFLADLKADFGVDVAVPKGDSEEVELEGPKANLQEAIAKIAKFISDIEARVTTTCIIPARDHAVYFNNGMAALKRISEAHNVQISFPDRKRRGKAENGGAKAENGDGGDVGENGDVTPAKEDTVSITGLPDDCAKAAADLLELRPVEEVIDIDADYHRFIIGAKGDALRKFMQEHDVYIKFPLDKTATAVSVRGSKDRIPGAIAALKEKVKELDADKADREARGFAVELSIDPRFHIRLIGKQGAVVNKLRTDFEVEIDFPRRKGGKLSSAEARTVTVRGYEAKAKAAAEDIMATVAKLQSLVTIKLDLNPGCHRKIIGKGGSNIRALQSKHEVRIFMPREDGEPVRIEGPEKTALDCKDELLELEEEYLQGEDEYADSNQYVKPSRHDNHAPKAKATPFNMKGAPWEKAPNTADSASFPGLGGGESNGAAAAPSAWVRK